MDRRNFLSIAGKGAAIALANTVLPGNITAQKAAHPHSATQKAVPEGAADYTLRIQEMSLELAPGATVKTVGYNAQVPGPLVRMKQGVPVTVDVLNDTSVEDLLHWHGFDIDPINDGAMEEGSPMIPPKGKVRYSFTPKMAGSRWYHTHNSAGKDLTRATYTGQFGFAYVEPKQDPGHYDQEIFLPIHHWGPKIEMLGPPVNGCEVVYQYASFNDKLLSASAPIKVKKGQRVLFHFLNASATQNVSLALPGHQFEVIALDGNPIPTPTKVDSLFIAVAERIDAIVEMNQPGVWILGSTNDEERKIGLGIPIEYAGSTGPALWKAPASVNWDYLRFGKTPATDITADETKMMIFGKKAGGAKDGMDLWIINGKAWPDGDPILVKEGKRYRLSLMNASPELHPVHLHRHSFEVVSINGKKTSGIIKDTINMNPFGRVELDFVANNPGPALFHCHQQLHMDYGFIQIIRYA